VSLGQQLGGNDGVPVEANRAISTKAIMVAGALCPSLFAFANNEKEPQRKKRKHEPQKAAAALPPLSCKAFRCKTETPTKEFVRKTANYD